jgi:Phosphate-selective porin O and P
MTAASRVVGRVALAIVSLLAGASTAPAQVIIKVNDDVNFKLGVLGQFQADVLRDTGTDVNTTNLFVRRLRLLFGGQVAKNVTFFVETDTPNLGRTLATGKNITPATIIQDAYGEFKHSNAFAIDAGLMFVPFSRNSVQSAATLLPIDYGAYTFSQSAPTQSSTGRDTGFQAKGYFLKNRLEYRIGAFQGLRNARSNNALRYTGRLQYNVLDPEVGFFYAGTYVGAKKILAIGGAFDTQSHYHAYDADVFTEYPFGPGAFTGQLDITRFDGDVTLPTLPKQNDVLLEIGYLLRAIKVAPILQFVHRDVVKLSTTTDETRTSIGANYWWAAHNANIKAAYTHIDPRGLSTQHEFTVQLQLFYY